jgi:hypothetical protein
VELRRGGLDPSRDAERVPGKVDVLVPSQTGEDFAAPMAHTVRLGGEERARVGRERVANVALGGAVPGLPGMCESG